MANPLVPDLVAYQGPSTAYSGPTVAPLQDVGVVDGVGGESGPQDVFSVFDAIIGVDAGLDGALAPIGAGECSGGKSAVSMNTLAVGSHAITGIYGRDASFLARSSGVLVRSVNQAAASSVGATSVAIDVVLGALSTDDPAASLIDDLASEQVSAGGRRANRID